MRGADVEGMCDEVVKAWTTKESILIKGERSRDGGFADFE
jgi:hypothetical protein